MSSVNNNMSEEDALDLFTDSVEEDSVAETNESVDEKSSFNASHDDDLLNNSNSDTSSSSDDYFSEFQNQTKYANNDEYLPKYIEPEEEEKALIAAREAEQLAAREASRATYVPAEPIDLDIAEGEIGRLLKRYRKSRNLSLENVEEETKIKKVYVEALEQENFNSLPPLVYVIAYLKKLAAYYAIPENKTEVIIDKLKSHLENQLPENIADQVKGHDINPEADKQLKHFILAIICGAIFIATIIGVCIFLIVVKPSGGSTDQNTVWEDKVMELQPEPKLNITVVPIKEQPTNSRNNQNTRRR